MSILTDPVPLIRLTEANYGDGIGAPIPGGDPATVSASLFDQDGDMPNDAGISNLFVAWGQFLDHDLSLSLENEDESLTADGLSRGTHRSEFVLDDDGARVPTNAITWQIDGSQVYGSTQDTTQALRSGKDGHLRMGEDQWSDMGLLPDDHAALMETGGSCPFAAGDIRANENPALASMHTLMAREHNYWADRLAEEHPDWDDDQLFDGARQIVEYELQKVTYEEWLPHLVGDAVGAGTGYDPDAVGQVSVEFSTAAFRFGHTMVSSTLPRMDDAGDETGAGDMSIMDVFMNTDPIRESGIDAIIRGQAASFAQNFDTKVVDDLNFFLFADGEPEGFSLVALNMLRGQDHGLQSYLNTRAALLGDIDPTTIAPDDFSVITSDPDQQAALAAVYDSVHDVDLWVGGLAEDAVAGAQTGPLFTFIIADQFTRTRAADETFGDLDPALGAGIIDDVQNSTISDIIQRNTEIDMMQDDPFLAMERALETQGDIFGTNGDDTIALVACDVIGEVSTGDGADRVTITGGTKVSAGLKLGAGTDTLVMSSGQITGVADMGSGDDNVLLSGAAHIDDLFGGTGDDQIAVTESAKVQTLYGGVDDDHVTITSRATVNAAILGTGDDTITLAHGANVHEIDGGSGHDTLRVTGGDYRVDWTNDDPATQSGTVVYLDKSGAPTGETTQFRNIEAIACFTKGTRIITATGARLIEDIAVGDAVYTLDHGLQPVLWVGSTTVLAEGDLAPVRLSPGALGNLRATEVSPQHRMLLSDWRCALVCGDDEVLAPAANLTNNSTITRRHGGTVTYVHLLFADHQIIFGDGIPSESFHPGRATLGAMPAATKAEVCALFPELAQDADAFGPSARITAKRHEVNLITALSNQN